ncbi:MAG TPA: putative porin [Bacteroidales bacterium]|nr:putative porin [Bacteroidales bacterium]
MRKCLFIAVILILSGQIFAQDTIQPGRKKGKPVSSYDTAKAPRILREWTLTSDFSEEEALVVDTLFNLSHRVGIADKFSPVNATLGNYGLPFYQVNFFDRVNDPDKFLYKYYYPFMYVPENAFFLNTQVPYTELKWSFAGKRQNSEQIFMIMHTQNVNRFLNFGLIYDVIFSLGQYNFQRADDKNFTFFSSYVRDNYKLYFSSGLNNITSYENGGIPDLSQLETQTELRNIPVNLGASNAVSKLKNKSLLLVQRYTIGNKTPEQADTTETNLSKPLLSGTFSHILTIEENKRTYEDQFPRSGFYDSVYIKGTSMPVFDSLTSRFIKNTIRFDFVTDETRRFRLGGGIGIKSELFRYSQMMNLNLDDTATIRTLRWLDKNNNNAVIGSLYNNIGDKFGWSAKGDLFLNGYRAGDFSLNGAIKKSFALRKGTADWIIRGGMSNTQPSIWYERWSSSNFRWNTNLSKEFRLNAGTDLMFPANIGEIRFDYSIIDNYTDFDSTAMPSQFSGGLSVAALTIKKELRAWKFHLATDLILQQSSNKDILDLPLLTVRSAGYFEHLFKFRSTGGNLNTQIGVDVTYNTEYNSYSYMPATGRFFRQSLVKSGNYPFIDLFIDLKVRRTRIFIMLDHANAGLMGYDYTMIPSYPMNTRMLRYGLAWTFYD